MMQPPVRQARGKEPAGKSRKREISASMMTLGVAALVGCAWAIGRWGGFTAGSTLGYNLGLAGGLMMLLLFSYPLRKHFRFMRGFGPAKHWFALHMALGILGPLFILAHSRFHVGSINAGIALASMSLVAISGIVGRFIYTRIHHGLYGHRANHALDTPSHCLYPMRARTESALQDPRPQPGLGPCQISASPQGGQETGLDLSAERAAGRSVQHV
jgi:hypothetical protein